MRYLGAFLAACLVAAAIFAALLAADVDAWQRTLVSDDEVGRTSTPSTYLPASWTEDLLSVRDDRDFREGLTLYRRNAHQAVDYSNAVNQAISRSRAEGALNALLREGGPPKRTAQIQALIGILAFGDFARGNNDPSQSALVINSFQDAVQLDPSSEDAKYDLELALRVFSHRGIGTGFSNTRRPGAQNKRGAGSGTPGSGY